MATRLGRQPGSGLLCKEPETDDLSLWRALLDATAESLLIVSTRGKILMTNKTGAQRLGKTPEQLPGMTLHKISPEVLPPSVLSHRVKMMEHVERTGEPIRFTDSRCGRFYDNHVHPLRDRSGEIHAVAIYAADITELVQGREAQGKYRHALVEAKYLALMGAVHRSLIQQLAQPLTSLALSIENALAKPGGSPSSQCAIPLPRDAVTEVRRAVMLLEKWRDRSRTAAGTDPLKTDVPRVAEETIEILEEMAWRGQVRIRLTDLSNLPPARISVVDLKVILYAMIECTMQPADGVGNRELEIKGVMAENQVGLELRAGYEVASQDRDRISPPFFGTQTCCQSMDLGLTIIQHLVSEAGGTVHVESNSGTGTIFLVRLPIAK